MTFINNPPDLNQIGAIAYSVILHGQKSMAKAEN
jgi:hypothetical protein